MSVETVFFSLVLFLIICSITDIEGSDRAVINDERLSPRAWRAVRTEIRRHGCMSLLYFTLPPFSSSHYWLGI